MFSLRRRAGRLLAATALSLLSFTSAALARHHDKASDGPTIYGHRGAAG
jgi:hypothetical protein